MSVSKLCLSAAIQEIQLAFKVLSPRNLQSSTFL